MPSIQLLMNPNQQAALAMAAELWFERYFVLKRTSARLPQLGLVGPFFGSGGGQTPWPHGCRQPPFTADSVYAPNFDTQRSHMEAYLSTVPSGQVNGQDRDGRCVRCVQW